MVKLLSVHEVADRLSLSTRTIWRLLRRGDLTELKIGKSVRIDAADLQRFVESKKQAGDRTGGG